MKIASYVNTKGEVVDFFEDGAIYLFENREQGWEGIQTVPLSVNGGMSLSEMKSSLVGAIQQIKGCSAFLARDLRGIFRVFLEEQGFTVWKSEGELNVQLNNVMLRDQESRQEQDKPVPSILPVGGPADGNYCIDLIELLASGIPMVSHEILMPFFETVSFRQLEIICEHIPKWFSFELEELGLKVESQTPNASGIGISVVVAPGCGVHSCPSGRRKRSFSCNCGG
jgi:Fe-only nitrogenase accessory protein AnfO